MIKLGSWLKSLFSTNPIAPEIVRAKAYEMWKAQGGGIVDPDANWQAAIAQLQLQEKLTRRNFVLELIRLLITSLSTAATIFGGSILFLNFSQGENRLITERFTRSIEQLGDRSETIRIGGIYALERIAKDSPKDSWTIMEVLSSFIRGNGNIKGQDPAGIVSPISTDSQAALTVIKRRRNDSEDDTKYLDLSFTNLNEANLIEAKLDRSKLNNSLLLKVDLRQARLSYANLSNAKLNGANLSNAKLNGANLIQADLSNTNLSAVDFDEVNLNKANLSDAILDGAKLTNASLGNTDLSRTILIGANLQGATLSKSNLTKADLSGANLDSVNFSGANLNKADFRKAKNITITQIQQAQNWMLAIFDPEIDRLLKPQSTASKLSSTL
jgi:uncharacterized protein YjbI with pentapeptide repeats